MRRAWFSIPFYSFLGAFTLRLIFFVFSVWMFLHDMLVSWFNAEFVVNYNPREKREKRFIKRGFKSWEEKKRSENENLKRWEFTTTGNGKINNRNYWSFQTKKGNLGNLTWLINRERKKGKKQTDDFTLAGKNGLTFLHSRARTNFVSSTDSQVSGSQWMSNLIKTCFLS